MNEDIRHRDVVGGSTFVASRPIRHIHCTQQPKKATYVVQRKFVPDLNSKLPSANFNKKGTEILIIKLSFS